MNIGIDFDGVINTNNAITMAILEKAIAHKLGYRVYNSKALNSKDRYGFNDADYDIYQTLRHNQINSQQYFAKMQMMSGAENAIKTLNNMGHKTYLVTSRGCDSNGQFDPNVRQYIHQTLTKWGILDRGLIIDENYSFSDPTKKKIDKVFQCKQLGVTLLVDDHWKYIQKVRKANIAAIHFGVEVQNWPEVVRAMFAVIGKK